MTKADSKKIYEQLKFNLKNVYDEEIHCPMILDIMLDKKKGSLLHFCTEVYISVTTFHRWRHTYPLFSECYEYGKTQARINWEEEGEKLASDEMLPGMINHVFHLWKMRGRDRFGFGAMDRVKIKLNPEDNAIEHYKQLIEQASNEQFSASELKQLMEALNIGINAHHTITLQKEIDELKDNLLKLDANKNGLNKVADK